MSTICNNKMTTGFWVGLFGWLFGQDDENSGILRTLENLAVNLVTEGFLKKNIMNTVACVGIVEVLQHSEVFLLHQDFQNHKEKINI